MNRMPALLAVTLVCAACGHDGSPAARGDCAGLDPLFSNAAFVIVTTPAAGDTVAADFEVAGCSRTFESNVVWTLRGRDGRVLASGYANGGGADGAGPFVFAVSYSPTVSEVGSLEVAEPAVSEGEGFPPPRAVLPLALAGGSGG